ncbi:zinc finger protein 729 [Elysia marginata]|uniref:Zinc finger protein 729 n=1 Tax=Elysia marginata TaxID=1093978 RepID=A0AAV4IZV2_9GAST|nr:zinc finger protein 729 [Elysia marginata]
MGPKRQVEAPGNRARRSYRIQQKHGETSLRNRIPFPKLSTQLSPVEMRTLTVRISPLPIEGEPASSYSRPVEQSDQVFSCVFCEYVDADKAIVSLHLTEVHRCRLLFACTECDYQTNIKELFVDHVTLHVSVGLSQEKEQVNGFEDPYIASEFSNNTDIHFGHTHSDEDKGLEENCSEPTTKLFTENKYNEVAIPAKLHVKDVSKPSDESVTDVVEKNDDSGNVTVSTGYTGFPFESSLLTKTSYETFDSFREALKKIPALIKVMPRGAFSCEDKFSCFKCNYVASSFRYFRDHFNEHVGVTPYACKFCNAKFPSAHIRLKHIQKMHQEVKCFSCDQCSFSTKMLRYLEMHKLSKHATEENYKFHCPHCEEKFTMHRRLKAHLLAKHSEVKKYECDKCDFSTNYKETFTHHLNKQHIGHVYVCPACKMSFLSTRQLRQHQESHKEMFCGQCPFFSRCKEDLDKHEANHWEDLPYRCPHCNFQTKKESVLFDHKRRHLNTKVDRITRAGRIFKSKTDGQTNGKPPEMMECVGGQEEVTATESKVESNLDESENEKPTPGVAIEFQHTTEICSIQNPQVSFEDSGLKVNTYENVNVGSLQSSTVKMHEQDNLEALMKLETGHIITKSANETNPKKFLNVKTMYKTFTLFREALKENPLLIEFMPSSAFPNEREFQCCKCTYSVTTFRNFQEHFFEHAGVTPYSCKHCKAKFSNAHSLRAHIRSLHETDFFYCDLCPFSTKISANLKKHKLSRHPLEEDFKFQCPDCPKKFALKRNLKSHQQAKHTAQKKYKCDQCDFATNYRDSIRIHANKHNGIIFLCSKCGNSYPDEARLKCHMKTHEELYFCDRCSFSTTRAQSFKRHQMVHSDKKPYQCPHCSFRSKSAILLYQHKQRHKDSKGNFRRVRMVRRRPLEKVQVAGKNSQTCVPDTDSIQDFQAQENVRENLTVTGDLDTLAPVPVKFDGPSIKTDQHMEEPTKSVVEKTRETSRKYTTFSAFREALKQTPKIIQFMPRLSFQGEIEFACTECDYVSRTFRYFQEHFYEHAGLTPYSCKYCSMKFSSAHNMYSHINHTHETEVFHCSICSFQTKRLPLLQKHVQCKHAEQEELKFKCPHCPKKFSVESKLKYHVSSVHTEQKKYKCDQCSYSTDKAGCFATHMDRHLGLVDKYPTFAAFKEALAQTPEIIQSLPRTSFSNEEEFSCFRWKRKQTHESSRTINAKTTSNF